VVFNERYVRSTDCRGLKGALFMALKTKERSHMGTEGERGGFILLAPLRNYTPDYKVVPAQ